MQSFGKSAAGGNQVAMDIRALAQTILNVEAITLSVTEARKQAQAQPADASLNQTLTKDAIQQLTSFCDAFAVPETNDIPWGKIVILAAALDGRVLRGAGPPPEELHGLTASVQELEYVEADTLSFEFRNLKEGLKKLPREDSAPMGVARRIDALLEESGEPPLNMISERFRVDRSTTPPTRVRRTQREVDEQTRQFRVRLGIMQRTKPRLYAAVEKLLNEKDPLFPDASA